MANNNNAELYITANVDIGLKPLILGGTGVSSAGALRKGGAGATTYYGPVTLTGSTTLAVDSGATRDAGSRFSATIGGTAADYFLKPTLLLGTTTGTSRTSVDQFVDSAVRRAAELHLEARQFHDVEEAFPEGTEPVGRLVWRREGELALGVLCNEARHGAIAEDAATGLAERCVGAVARGDAFAGRLGVPRQEEPQAPARSEVRGPRGGGRALIPAPDCTEEPSPCRCTT